jgi:alkylation response protein AidB-like acyl-CoA dehydrogenase
VVAGTAELRDRESGIIVTEEAKELRRTVRKFLEQRCSEADVRRLMEDQTGYDVTTWKQAAEQLGLHGMAIPEAFGGSGFGFAELCIVFEEMGRALCPSPFFATIALAATCLQLCGDEDAKKAFLPGIAAGSVIATLAYSEQAGGWDDGAISAGASRSGAGWVLTGVKRYVPDVHLADLILVAARAPEGISLFAVESGAPGLDVSLELTMDLTRKLGVARLDGTPARLIGSPGGSADVLRRALRVGAVALAAEQVGGAQRLLEQTVAYAKTRIQFGRTIGSFQAIKHKLANMLIDVEYGRAVMEAAITAVDDDAADLELAASIAKSFCSDAYFRVAAESLQVFGGIGFTWEHSAHLYFKRAKSSQVLLGSPAFHRELVGQAIGV